MKLTKRMLALALAALMALSLAACAPNKTEETTAPTEASTTEAVTEAPKASVNLAVLKGPTGIGLTKLMSDNEEGTASADYSITVASAPDEIVGKIASGEVDIAAAPINLAATLYAKTNGNVQILAINTLGVLYLLQNGVTVSSVADLKGKTIHATGQGSTPEYILNYILTANGLDPEKDVTIQYVEEHAALAAQVAAGEVEIAMLPEPNVTAALSQNPDVTVALELTKEWEKACALNGVDGAKLVQGCLIVRKNWEGNTPETIQAILKDSQASIDFVNSNVEQAAQLCEKYEIIPKAAVAAKAIPNCNITFIQGAEMKTLAEQNLQVLFDANPKSVGGAMPQEDFYYVAG